MSALSHDKIFTRVWQCSHFFDDAIPFWNYGWLCWIMFFFSSGSNTQTNIIVIIKLLKVPILNTILDTVSKLTENCVSMFYAKLELAFACSIDRIKLNFSFLLLKIDFFRHPFGVAFAWTHLTIRSNLIILHLILFIQFKESEMEKMNVWCAMVKQYVEWWQCLLFDFVTLLGLVQVPWRVWPLRRIVLLQLTLYLCDTNI